jgi:hypothetical protein
MAATARSLPLPKSGRGSNEIFGDTWEPSNLRAAKYYLRIAPDLLILPGGERHLRGDPIEGPIILRPGDVVFVTTVESVRMPWDLSGHVSLRFRYAVEGALVLTGGLVDPGYGTRSPEGERLHFVIANIGRKDFPIVPGTDQIASLEFTEICGEPDQSDPATTEDLERRLFQSKESPRLALEFFEQLKEVDDRLDSEIRSLTSRFQAVESGTKQIVYFGVFLLTVTLFGVAFALLAQLAASDSASKAIQRIDDVLPDTWPAASVVIIALVVAAVVLWKLLTLISDGIAAVAARRRDGGGRPPGGGQRGVS